MQLRQVETFEAVAEELSFSRAAARLGYVQSSVSAQVTALERELGVPPFDRLGRTIALTEAGTVMVAYSRKLLSLAEETREAVADTGADAGAGSGEVTGSLTVSAPETLLTHLAWHESRWKSPALVTFLETARDVFSARARPHR